MVISLCRGRKDNRNYVLVPLCGCFHKSPLKGPIRVPAHQALSKGIKKNEREIFGDQRET